MNEWDPVWGAIKKPDPTIWIWDVVGGGLIVVKLPREVSWFKRIRTKIFLGSTWKKVGNLPK
jgi:hypothetical protein